MEQPLEMTTEEGRHDFWGLPNTEYALIQSTGHAREVHLWVSLSGVNRSTSRHNCFFLGKLFWFGNLLGNPPGTHYQWSFLALKKSQFYLVLSVKVFLGQERDREGERGLMYTLTMWLDQLSLFIQFCPAATILLMPITPHPLADPITTWLLPSFLSSSSFQMNSH